LTKIGAIRRNLIKIDENLYSCIALPISHFRAIKQRGGLLALTVSMDIKDYIVFVGGDGVDLLLGGSLDKGK
jgi:hypothetical protein